MVITVRAFGALRNHMPGMVENMELPLDGLFTVADVIAHLNLPDYEIWLTQVNGRKVDQDHPLQDGDVLSIFAPVAGGN